MIAGQSQGVHITQVSQYRLYLTLLTILFRITDWDLTLPSLQSKLYQHFPKVTLPIDHITVTVYVVVVQVVSKVNASDEHIAFVQVRYVVYESTAVSKH